jgi:hypothetical protein
MLLMHNRHIPKQGGGVTRPSHSITTSLLWLKDGMQLEIVSSESLESSRWDLKILNIRPQVTVAILRLMVAIMLMETAKKKKTEKWYAICIISLLWIGTY